MAVVAVVPADLPETMVVVVAARVGARVVYHMMVTWRNSAGPEARLGNPEVMGLIGGTPAVAIMRGGYGQTPAVREAIKAVVVKPVVVVPEVVNSPAMTHTEQVVAVEEFYHGMLQEVLVVSPVVVTEGPAVTQGNQELLDRARQAFLTRTAARLSIGVMLLVVVAGELMVGIFLDISIPPAGRIRY